MPTKKQTHEILPWENSELEILLRKLIEHGTETPKADFKLEIEMGTPDYKADLLTDISAIANTYDEENYGDHGFIIYGVKAKTINGTTQTEVDTDKLQNDIEQILKSYISPMPQIYVIGFNTPSNQKWGVIIIPPRNNKPYMFFKDLQCTDPRRTRRKGEWFIRRGSTNDRGLAEDLAVITQKQMESTLEPLRESIRNLQLRVGRTEEQYNSALFKLLERAVAITNPAEKSSEQEESVDTEIGRTLGMDLSIRLKQKLRTSKDVITEDLITETKKLRNYLDGSNTGLTWAPQLNNSDGNRKTIEDIEEKTRTLQLSIATILLNDHKGIYTEALLRAIKMLAKAVEVPSGTQYNRIGEALRYYPLGLIIYTIFVCGVITDRNDILKQVLKIPLKHQRRSANSDLIDVFFYWYEAKALFNDAFAQRWCEPISQRIRQVINDHISEMITEFSESEYFFRGEFVLALTYIDACIAKGESAENQLPLPGLYLYMHEASDSISEFLLEHPKWFEKFYSHPINEILDAFDKNAHKMSAPNCIATGMYGANTLSLYQESLKRNSN